MYIPINYRSNICYFSTTYLTEPKDVLEYNIILIVYYIGRYILHYASLQVSDQYRKYCRQYLNSLKWIHMIQSNFITYIKIPLYPSHFTRVLYDYILVIILNFNTLIIHYRNTWNFSTLKYYPFKWMLALIILVLRYCILKTSNLLH